MWRELLAFTALTAFAELAKGVAIPLIAAAVLIILVLGLLKRSHMRLTIVLLALVAIAYLISGPLVAPADVSHSLALMPFESLKIFPGWNALTKLPLIGGILETHLVLHAIASLSLFAIGIIIPIIGVLLLFIEKKLRISTAEVYLFMIAVVGLGAFLLLGQQNGGYGVQSYFWIYAFPFFALLGASGLRYVNTMRCKHFGKSIAVLVGVIAMLSVISTILVDRPVEQTTFTGESDITAEESQITPEELSALFWIREHTQPDTVLAINNQDLLYYREPYAGYYPVDYRPNGYNSYYSAFSERRFLLEGYVYTVQMARSDVATADQMIADRRALNDAIFVKGDPEAIQQAHTQFNVSYLLVDKRAKSVSGTFDSSMTDLVFSNSAMDVYRIR